jgi:hypothetical protein
MVWTLYEEHQDFAAIYRQLEHILTGVTGEGSVKPHITLASFRDFTDIRQIQLSGTAFPEHIVCDRLIESSNATFILPICIRFLLELIHRSFY